MSASFVKCQQNLAIDYRDYLRLLPKLKEAAQYNVWLAYDAEADVLYINFQKPSLAIDSELSDEDVIIRYGENDEVVGITVLHASQRA